MIQFEENTAARTPFVRRGTTGRNADKVAIIASGPTMKDAPFNDPSFDLYALNAAHRQFDASKVTTWFQIHRPGSGEGHIDDPDHLEWLTTFGGCPIFMVDKFPWAPNSQPFPLQEVSNDVCPGGLPFFASTVDFMFAYAIHVGYKEIHAFGCDMIADADHEFHLMKPSASYYLGVAEGRGIKVVIPAGSALLKTDRVYGFEPRDPRTKRLIDEHQAVIADLKKEQAEHDRLFREYKAKSNANEGAIHMAKLTIHMLEMRERGGQF